MAAFHNFLFTIFISVFLALKCEALTNETVSNTGSSSNCICDLVVNGCDVNCCCDVDCSASDKESFTECKESRNIIYVYWKITRSNSCYMPINCTDHNESKSNPALVGYDDRVCVSDQMIFIQNVPFTTQNTGDGLFCIIHNNNNNQDEYSNVETITNGDDFTNAVSTRNLYSYNIEDKTENTQSEDTNYKVGDSIFLLSNMVRGYLSLPTSLDSSTCNDLNPAGYFQDDATQCVRSFFDLPTQCSNLPAISAKSYFTDFQIGKTPNPFSTYNSSSGPIVTSSFNASLLFAPTLAMPLLCRQNSGFLQQCDFTTPPDPVYNASSQTCENVVTEVSYTFIYSNESTSLEKLNVSLVLGNVQGNFVQKFSVTYLKEDTRETFKKSGNPGYLIDQPLLAGMLITDPSADKEAILLSTNKKDWLTIAKASLDGSCGSSVNDRLLVKFNINTRSGCMIRVNASSNCTLLQDIAFSALLGPSPPDYVASFGNSDVKIIADWVKIINDRPGNSATTTQSGCENMVLGMHIEILFAKIGYIANPQAKVVGVRFKYEQAKALNYQCFGQFCQDRGQSFEVVSSVAFIDVSQPPSPDQKALPEFQSKAPADFFHPFL